MCPEWVSLHWRAKTFSSLSFDRIIFLYMDFTFSESLCYVLLYSRARKKNFLFWRLSNDCQIACPALVSGLSNRKPYNKHIVGLVFSVRAVRAINRWKKTRSVIYCTDWELSTSRSIYLLSIFIAQKFFSTCINIISQNPLKNTVQ